MIGKVFSQGTVKTAYDGASLSVSPGLKSAKVWVLACHAQALTVIERPGRSSQRASTCFSRKAYRLSPDRPGEAVALIGVHKYEVVWGSYWVGWG